MTLDKYKKYNLKNYEDILFIYNQTDYIKSFIDKKNNINIMRNLDVFITFLIEEFNIETHERCFIVTCFFEQKYFKKRLKKGINYDKFKKIIVNQVISVLVNASKYSNIIFILSRNCGLDLTNNRKNIVYNFEIIKLLILKKRIKFNYCFLFDNIKYFENDEQKLNNYLRFIEMFFYDYYEDIQKIDK